MISRIWKCKHISSPSALYYTIKQKEKYTQTNPNLNTNASNLYTEEVEIPKDYLEYLNKKIVELGQGSSRYNLDDTSSNNLQTEMIATIYERAVLHANNSYWEAAHRDISILLSYEPYNSEFLNLNIFILNNM